MKNYFKREAKLLLMWLLGLPLFPDRRGFRRRFSHHASTLAVSASSTVSGMRTCASKNTRGLGFTTSDPGSGSHVRDGL
jgi:hypothetical protein